MGRSVLAIVVGYLVFGVSAALLFGLSGRDPHAAPSLLFALSSILYGIVFAALAGFAAASLAPRNGALHANILASIVAAIALLSLALQFQTGSMWSELATLFLMAPAAVAGGRIAARRTRSDNPARA